MVALWPLLALEVESSLEARSPLIAELLVLAEVVISFPSWVDSEPCLNSREELYSGIASTIVISDEETAILDFL